MKTPAGKTRGVFAFPAAYRIRLQHRRHRKRVFRRASLIFTLKEAWKTLILAKHTDKQGRQVIFIGKKRSTRHGARKIAPNEYL